MHCSLKGAKDRYTMLPEIVIPALREHLERVKLTHEQDLREGHGEVYLPGALDRKYRNPRWSRYSHRGLAGHSLGLRRLCTGQIGAPGAALLIS